MVEKLLEFNLEVNILNWISSKNGSVKKEIKTSEKPIKIDLGFLLAGLAGLPINFGRGVARAVYRLVSQSPGGGPKISEAEAQIDTSA